MKALTTEVKKYKVIYNPKSKKPKTYYLTEEERNSLIIAINNKQHYATVNGDILTCSNKFEFDKVNAYDIDKMNGKFVVYTDEIICGQEKGTGIAVYKLEKIKQILKKESDGFCEKKILSVKYGYYKDSRFIKIKNSDVEFPVYSRYKNYKSDIAILLESF